MPRIEERLLKTVVYLYASKDDAENGEPGASGFLVGEPCALPGRVLLFAVTNTHVIKQLPVVRTAGPPGSNRVFVRQESDWFPHPDDHDVAVTPVSFAPTNSRDLNRDYVPREWFVTHESFTQATMDEDELQPLVWPFGAGEEVMMLGRFLGYDGTDENQPTARFGHLAIAKPVRIKQEARGYWQESFLIECRSVTGYSGSPVFIFRPGGTFGAGLEPLGSDRAKIGIPRLLGVDWGNLNRIGLYDYAIDWTQSDAVKKFATWSGMLAAVPAWRLAELLDSGKVQDMKKQLEADANKDAATLDFEPSEFDRFAALTRKLVAVPKKEVDKLRKKS